MEFMTSITGGVDEQKPSLFGRVPQCPRADVIYVS